MSSSLREQLLKLGLGKRRPSPARDAGAARPPAARTEKIAAAEREARRARLRERVETVKLDDAAAEIKHYYSTGRKIKRIYVTQAQQAALARGAIVIVVVQGKGRLVDRALVASLREIDPDARIIDPSTVCETETDPAHQVPDDLRW
jgi:hypothetical protein